MVINKKDAKALYKKLRRLLKSLFIDIQLVKFLSARKLYKLMWRTMKYDERFNYSKKEVKSLAKAIVEIDFENVKQEKATCVADFVMFILKDQPIKRKEAYTEEQINNYVRKFYAEFPLTLE